MQTTRSHSDGSAAKSIYLVVVNDNRSYDARVGQYKAVLGKLLPQSTMITIKRWGHNELFAYDMLERKPLQVTKVGDAHKLAVELTELGGKIIALCTRKLDGINILTAKAIRRGKASPIRFSVLDDDGIACSGLQPLEATITDARGAQNEYSGYYCARNGLLDIHFVAAINDEPGQWTVSVSDLTAGLTAKAELQVVK